jgi:hypothetical protein
MHTRTDTADLITTAGGDHVFTIKANQRRLFQACTALPWEDVPSHTLKTRGHGRTTTRTIKVVTAPARIEPAGAAQVAPLRRTLTTNGKRTLEVVHLITSADHHDAPPATLAAWVPGHRGIENRHHRVRDVTYDEDRSQVRTAKRTPSHDHPAQYRHQPLTTDRHREHRPRPTTSRPRPRNRPQTAPDPLKHVLAGPLMSSWTFFQPPLGDPLPQAAESRKTALTGSNEEFQPATS